MRIIAILLIILATISLVLWALASPNDVSFAIGSFEGETSRVFAGILIALLGAIIAVCWNLLAYVFKIPLALTRTANKARFGKARTALTDGLIAAEGGDPQNALKKARKSSNLSNSNASDRKLALLLAARAFEANGDWDQAEHSYSDLAREKGAELVGLRGLAAAAIQRGDLRGAETHTRKALELKTNATWPFSTLFELHTKAADWQGAIDTLKMGEKRHLIELEAARRRRAVLYSALATDQRMDASENAEKHASEAARMAPSFPPAAYLAARMQLASGKVSKAQSTIEGAWRIRPHPALALLWRDLKRSESSSDRAKRLKNLAGINPTHRESRILLVEAAMIEGNWNEAEDTLHPLLDEGETTRLCTLMEAIANGRDDIKDAAKWSRLASSASREADWSDIDPDGRAFNYSSQDWARLIYSFGDEGVLIHPRYETYGGELETIAHIALPAPVQAAAETTPSVEVLSDKPQETSITEEEQK